MNAINGVPPFPERFSFWRYWSSVASTRDLLIVPHELLGSDCCGCLVIELRGDQADVVCNDGVIVRTVPAAEAADVLKSMASEETCSAICPHCGAVNTFAGFDAMEAFVCRECGEGVVVSRAVQ